MLVFSFRIPEGSRGDRGPHVMVLILEKENLDRMRQGDPLDIQFAKYAGGLPPINAQLKQVDLVVAYEEDLKIIMDFQRRQDLAGLMRHLERGRRIVPGDVQPPVPLREI
jgi:hypothetical protein